MRSLVRKFLDEDLSRRGFIKELAAVGVSLASAEALLGSISSASAAEAAEPGEVREVTGNGGDIVMETLLEADVECIFHGCGAGTNTFFDSIVTRPKLKNFLATNEGQCVAMAEGYNVASGKIGVVIVPKAGLGNAASNIYNALMDRASVLVITARDSSEFSERNIDLELVDWEQAVDPFVRNSYKIERLDRASEYTRRAITVANTPPGGPTFLQMTEDMYAEQATVNIQKKQNYGAKSEIRPDEDQIMATARLLIESEQPLITVGPEITKTGGQEQMIELAEMLALPVTEGLSGFADFPNNHPLFLGTYGPFLPQTRKADFYLCIGGQLPDEASYVHRGPPPVNAKTVHMTVEPQLLGMTYPTEMNVMGSANACIADLIDAINSLATKDRLKSIREARYDEVATFAQGVRDRRVKQAQKKWDQAPMTTARISSDLNAVLDDDAIIVKEPVYDSDLWFDVGFGNKTLIGGSGAGVLGWATGAALGVKLAQPNRQVVALSGDGAFMFQHNLWALSRYDAPVTVVIYNNHAYNMTRAFTWLANGPQAQRKQDLLNFLGDPDVNYAMIAQAYGVDSEVVTNPGDLKAAYKRALKANDDGRPYLLDVSNERWGKGGELTWHPDYSIAKMRS